MADRAPIVDARDVAVRYPGDARDAVRDVRLAMRAGERVGILGPSGCGKSTLALALAGAIPALVPGELSGTIAGPAHVAYVQQDVESQLVALSVDAEIAFALENRGLAPAAIDEAIAKALAGGPAVGLRADDETLALSTGWRQRLALAASVAEAAGLTILDEPTAHLDEAAAREAVAFMACGPSGALIFIEHRADLVAPHANRLLVLDRDGTPLALAAPAEALAVAAGRPNLGLRLPPATRAALLLRQQGHGPAGGPTPTPSELVAALEGAPDTVRAALREDLAPRRSAATPGRTLVALGDVSLRRGARVVLAGVSLSVGEGEVVGLAGGNGAGKTSLCLVVAGALRPGAGRRTARPSLAMRMVPQNPSLVFASASLGLEAQRRGLAWPAAARGLEAFGLVPDPRRHPLRHSRGEMRRIALALALAGGDPMLAILDEPTAGLDAHGLAALEASLAACRAAGGGALVVSHDTDWLARTCDRIVVIDAGTIVAEGTGHAICRRALDGRLRLAAPPAFALAAALGLELAA